MTGWRLWTIFQHHACLSERFLNVQICVNFVLFLAIVGYYPLCPRGCASCSSINGCVTCRPQYYLHLHRDGFRQTGMCLHSCPVSYFGLRQKNFNQCLSRFFISSGLNCTEIGECVAAKVTGQSLLQKSSDLLCVGLSLFECFFLLFCLFVKSIDAFAPLGCGKPHCEACFNRSYCTRCEAPYLAYRGECVEQCPDGLQYATYTKDCVDKGTLTYSSG